MNKKVGILGVQFNPKIADKEANLSKIEHILKQNKHLDFQMAVLPEVFNTGLTEENFERLAEEVPTGMTSVFVSELAKKHNVYFLAGSIIEKCPDGKIRNTSALYSPDGKLAAKYSKIHMFSYFGSSEGKYVTPGDSCCLVETDIGKIGLSICYDLRFPELYRKLTFGGAQMIFCPAAWPLERLKHWLVLNKARAVENLVWMISINQAGRMNEKRTNAGNSMIINPWGEAVTQGGSDEQAVYAQIDLTEIENIRKEFPVLNDRNLKAYGKFN
jgi:predicted amidohydrolase